MQTREEMRSLAEEIVGTYADRMATIGELRETVKLNLRELQSQMGELRDTRMALDKEMRVDLARDATNRKHEVESMLKELNSAHAAMSKELKADLAKGVSNRKSEVDIMLDGFGQALATMGKEMRADLAKGIADRKHEVGGMLRSFSAELKDIRSELAGGRDEWQILTSTMQAQRMGAAVEVEPIIEKTVEDAAEITPETAALSDRVFEYLANHPDGTKMTELEQEFRLARIQMAKVLKTLMDENKVEKQELLYFAI